MKKKDKKGMMTLKEMIYMIIGAICLVLLLKVGAVAFPLFLTEDKSMTAETQIENIVFRLGLLENEEEPYIIWNPDSWYLIGFAKNEESPIDCKNTNCLCICPAKKIIGLVSAKKLLGYNCEKGACKTLEKDIKIEAEIRIPKDIILNVNDIIEITEKEKSKVGEATKLTEEEKTEAKSFDDFIKKEYSELWVFGLGDCIIKAEKGFGVPKEVILAVALHESGDGKSGLSKGTCISKDSSEHSNNLFGMSADKGLGSAGKCNWPAWECYAAGKAGTNAVLEGSTCTSSNIADCQSKGKECYTLNRYFRAYKKKCDSIEGFANMISLSNIYKKAMENTDNIELMINYMINTEYYKCGYDGKQECSYATDLTWDEKVTARYNEFREEVTALV